MAPTLFPTASQLESLQRILHAAQYAAAKHAQQRRKGATAEPYVNHLLEVARLVSDALEEPDPNLVIAALLHDVVEDAGVTRADLVTEFNEDVASLVMEVTDDKSLPKQERKRLQVEHAPHKTVRAQVIKLADKISNLRAMLVSPPESWDVRRRREYVVWAEQVVAGLTAPSPLLMKEFRRLHAELLELFPES
ncbi:MAG: HD domain-containing protein [Bryobacterales bacterium]|nr:HD domain-containing protein [Bryobacterales bacterium]